MPTLLQTTATCLCLLGASHAAMAQEPAQLTEWPLGMAIAVQGDMALLDIQQELKHGIPQSMLQVMRESLPQELAVADETYSMDAAGVPSKLK